jgi:hypothetical protein
MANTGSDYEIINATEFDVSKDILYTKPKVNPQGGKSIGILNSNSKKGLYISTPLMLTWGVNENDFEGKGNVKYDMALQFPRQEYASEETTKFLENMLAMETKIKEDAVKNCKDWMNKAKMSSEVVDALFTPMVKYGKDPNTGEPDRNKNPTLTVKLPVWDGKFNIDLYDVEGEAVYPNDKALNPVDLVPKGSNVLTIIQCGGIWFINGKFGVSWKLTQAVIKPKQSMRGKCLINLSDRDKEAMKKTDDHDDDEEEEESAKVEVADSSDDEEEAPVTPQKEVAETIAEASPPPAPKKKVVRKKKVAEE